MAADFASVEGNGTLSKQFTRAANAHFKIVTLGGPARSIQCLAPSASLLCPINPTSNLDAVGVGMRVRGEHKYVDPEQPLGTPPFDLGFTRVENNCNLANWGVYGETRTNQFSD